MQFLPFDEARKTVQALGLKSYSAWKKYCKSRKKPSSIPSSPERVYKSEWNGWGDFLGTGRKAQFKGPFRSFESAKKYIQSLGLKNQNEWASYAKSVKKPLDIPAGPARFYKKEGWKGWGDFLATGRIANQKLEFFPFEDARKFVQSLRFKNRAQWRAYLTSGKKPPKIPANPAGVYRKCWKGLGDWLGTGTIAPSKRIFKSFQEGRDFARSLKLGGQKKWTDYCKTSGVPKDIPTTPSRVYKSEWKGWGDWLGTGYIAPSKRKYRSFEKAKEFVHALGLRSRNEWATYCKSGKKPQDIPYQARQTYKEDWKGWGDWLGTGTVANFKRQFLPFEEARDFVRRLNFKNQEEWRAYCASGNKPNDIPSNPALTQEKKWKRWGDFLGTGNVASFEKQFTDFNQARHFVHDLKLKNQEEWREYCRSREKPIDIPANPAQTYEKDWKGFGDWLGSGRTRNFRPFDEARMFARTLGLTNRDGWSAYAKTRQKPGDIPGDPAYVYKEDWKGWGDWLGTDYVAHQLRVYRSFEEARIFARSLGMKNQHEWIQFAKSKNKPVDIPANPQEVYQNIWTNWFDWFGLENTDWSVKRIKALLKGLIESKIIFDWDEAVLYSLLLRKGLLNISGNRHEIFFKNLIQACRTDEGRKKIEKYVYSDSNTPPNLQNFSGQNVEIEIQTASNQDLVGLMETSEPLDYGKILSVEQILTNTAALESFNVDEEAMQFYLNYSIDRLWKLAFQNEQENVTRIKETKRTGNKYTDSVLKSFLTDYDASIQIGIPAGYAFPYPPSLMQKYVSHKVKSLVYFGNFSATGAGKTLSAILASRVIASKMTVVVCPNDVVDQWRRSILEVFPDSQVTTGKDSFFATYSKNDYQYLVLNYDKFSQEESPNLILKLGSQKIDFVIMDEIHFSKIRDEDEISKRRRNLDGLMTLVRRKNPEVKVLGLSATPVVNNLREGKSLLELLSGKIYDDVSTKPTIPNAVTLFEKLSTSSIRELPKYSSDLDTHVTEVVAPIPPVLSVRSLKSNPLAIEKFLTDARIPEIIKSIEGQTIIYTEYVEDIIKKLSGAVETAGHTFALYTGYDRSGLTKFLNKKVQVLIASRPLSVGVDGLQHICNRLIINTLPWTNAQYQQLLGRLVRKGQIRDVVHVYLIKASIGGYEYDELKWKRIQFKRTLADCAVDGVLPEKNLVTPQQAAMEAVKWLERLERGEISTVVRRDLNVELAPVEIKKRIAKFGDFAKLNNRINNENSETTHERLLIDPKEWDEYHRQYREARKDWHVIPFVEIIKRIKQLSPRLMIGDFGCGEAQILNEFGENRVYSFDHVAINNKVKACDMKSTGLPDEAIDIAVFSLSLMGRDWPEYIVEAKRCLATGGYLLIADTTKSFDKRLSKIKEVIMKLGFEIYSQEEKGDFTFIEAREL